jgi:hypothetical protein
MIVDGSATVADFLVILSPPKMCGIMPGNGERLKCKLRARWYYDEEERNQPATH